MIWDQASWQTSETVQEALNRIRRIQTLLLPARAPEAHPVEDLWRELNGQIAEGEIAAGLERSLGCFLPARGAASTG